MNTLRTYGFPLSLAFIVCEAVLFFLMARVLLRKDWRHTFYSYRKVGLLGGSLFLLCCMVTAVVNLFPLEKTGEEQFAALIDGLVGVSRTFSLILLPVILLLFIVMIIGNLILLRREGGSPRNIIGAGVGFGLLAATLFEVFGWQLLRARVIEPQYAAGRDWVTVLDVWAPTFFGGLLCYLECFLIGVSVYAAYAVLHRPAYDKDFIIILGCYVRPDGTLTPLLQNRVDAALAFARAQEAATGKAPVFVPSGGQGSDESMSEAEAMRRYLLAEGVPDDRILPEDQSTSTRENMQFSKALIDAAGGDGARVAFATTNYHLFRSGCLARKAGLANAEGIAGRTRRYFWTNAFIREYVALLSMGRGHHLTVAVVVFITSLLLGFAKFFIKGH